MNPLYEFVSELKNRIAAGEISGYTALDLFYQHVVEPSAISSTEYIPEPVPEPVPEPASETPADGQTADAETE